MQPKLRFEGFKGEWEQSRLGDICTFSQGIQVPVEDQRSSYYDGSIPFVRIVDVTKKNEDIRYVDKPAEKYQVNTDDVFMVRYGAVGVVGRGFRGALANNLFKITIKESIINTYIYYYLTVKKVNDYIVSLASSTTMPALSFEIMKNVKVHYPKDLKEQQKIVDFFTLIDKKIDLQQEKIEKLEQYQKGMMHKIFSQGLRFKDVDGKEYPEWKSKKLDQISEVIMGQSPKGKNYSNDSNNTVLIQGNADMKNGKVVPRIYTSEITKTCLPGDILMSVRAPVGEIALTDITGCIGRGVCAIRANKFVYHYLFYFNLINAWNSLSQGSTFESVNGNDIKTLVIPTPSFSEEMKIEEYLTSLERKVEKEKEKLKLLEEQKKGFMQRMFV